MSNIVTIEGATLHRGDCLAVMRTMQDSSVDSIVTDPPYELGFMGKSWDSTGIAYNIEVWREALRVLKPGGHLLAFSGSRTYHRMTCAIEDAGFEIRDQIMWVYGSGFPKSMDVSKAMDKMAGAERTGTGEMVRGGCRAARGGSELVGSEPVESLKWKEITQPATEAAKQWDGWGTALKPAHEPIVVARKPLIGTVAENVLAHGTGALNIDDCRVGWPDGVAPEIGTPGWGGPSKKLTAAPGQDGDTVERSQPSQLGRWPANLIHDGSDEVLLAFPDAVGQQGKVTGCEPTANGFSGTVKFGGMIGRVPSGDPRNDAGSAARFFYCAKASKQDRDEGLHGFTLKEGGIKNDSGRGYSETDPMRKIMRANIHPTVKPTELLRYLWRLVTPPGGTGLDLFMGSGSGGKAAILEGFNYIGIELDEDRDGSPLDYFPVAVARITHAAKTVAQENAQQRLFA